MDHDPLAFLEKPADHDSHCSTEKPADHDLHCLHVTGETIVVSENHATENWLENLTQCHVHIQEFSSGGGGEWFILKKTIILQVSRGGPIFFRGTGVRLLIPYRNPYIFGFSMDEPPPPPPPVPHSGSAHEHSTFKKRISILGMFMKL